MQKLLTLFLISIVTIGIYAQDKPMATFHVLVVDNKENPQEGEKVVFKNMKNNSEVSGITNAEGKFEIDLIQDDEYGVTIVTFGKEDSPKIIKVPAASGTVNVDYKLITYYSGTFLLDIQFETAKATLDAGSYKTLDEFYEMLDLKKDMAVEIGGHTDNVGDDAYNQTLSQNRANTVRAYLIKKGIAENRIAAKGYGESQPVADNATPEGRQKNRRTEVKIVQE